MSRSKAGPPPPDSIFSGWVRRLAVGRRASLEARVTSAAAAGSPGPLRAGWRPIEDDSVLPPGEATRIWVGAAILALIGHVMWAAWLEPNVPPPGSRALPAAYLALLPPDQPGATDAYGFNIVRGVWSPGLFALPFSLGFSRPVMDVEFKLSPPLRAPGASSQFLTRSPERLPAREPGTSPAALASVPSLPALSLGESIRDTFAGFTQSPGLNLQIECAGGLQEWEPVRAELPDGIAGDSRSGWEITAFVRVDPAGWIRHVICERAAPEADINDRLIRALYSWRFPPADSERSGRVIIRHPGAPGLSAPVPTPGPS